MAVAADRNSNQADEPSAFLEVAMNQAIGVRLREERHRLGMTLQDVADRSGLSLGMISKIENAQTCSVSATVGPPDDVVLSVTDGISEEARRCE